MRRRIADDGGDRIAAVCTEQWRQAPLDLGKGLVPARLDKLPIALDQWPAQPVRVIVQIFQRRAFRADVAVAEHIGFMAADADDLVIADLEFQSAARFAQRADAVNGGFGGLG